MMERVSMKRGVVEPTSYGLCLVAGCGGDESGGRGFVIGGGEGGELIA